MTMSPRRFFCPPAAQLNLLDLRSFLEERVWPVVGHMEGARKEAPRRRPLCAPRI